MVLKELEIQGFKSFPDKVKITFGRGVTGVVGPNGSGKSNLSDAIRWVLGETSSRQLRSAGKMEDVIFGGTRRRGAMGYASVRLTLDNTDHTLDLDAPEVTIGRRYYRSGDSEYTINGQACRLKDVYELLLDTGIGRDGYSIIGQGRIAEIVAAKGSERREIFEEACGIAKYRYRRTEAEHSLAAAQANLERLRDILGELESRVGPLAREAEKAKAYLELAGRRKGLEVTLWVESIRAARAAMQQLQRDYETAQAAFERWDSQDKASQQEAEEIRMQAQRLTVEIERLNGDIRSITEQISGSDSRIAVLENDRVHARQSAESLRAELAAGQTGREAAAAGLERQILAYEAGLWVNRKLKTPLANPLLIAVTLIVGLMMLFHIPLESYQKGGDLIALFLAPATASLALSVYNQRGILGKNLLPVIAGCAVGSAVSMGSVYALCRLFKLDEAVTASLIPKSVTTPIATEISAQHGGIVPVTVAAVIITGMIGAVLAPYMIRMFHVRNPVADGLAIGASSHALGTSRALEMGELEGAMSGIAVGVSGLLTVLFSLVLG